MDDPVELPKSVVERYDDYMLAVIKLTVLQAQDMYKSIRRDNFTHSQYNNVSVIDAHYGSSYIECKDDFAKVKSLDLL